jgi:SNF2 family DNA or RNA helicase
MPSDSINSAPSGREYIIPCSFSQLNEGMIAQHAADGAGNVLYKLTPDSLQLNEARFVITSNLGEVTVEVQQQNHQMQLNCNCGQVENKLCSHQIQALYTLIYQIEYRQFFDNELRRQRLVKLAADYGLEHEAEPDRFFELLYENGKVTAQPRQTALLPVTRMSIAAIRELLLQPEGPKVADTEAELKQCLVIKQHKYYKQLILELYDAVFSKEGRVKNPLMPVNALEQVWESEDSSEIKFLTAVARFQNNMDGKVTASGLNSLKAAIANPLNLPCYLHRPEVSDKVVSAALTPVQLSKIENRISLNINQDGQFYSVSGSLKIGDDYHELAQLKVRFGYFIELNNTLYLAKDMPMLGAIQFFNRRGAHVLVHQSRFEQFRAQVLSGLEERTAVTYHHIPEATPQQITQNGFNKTAEKIIYLSDFGRHVMIVPVMRYGEIEIPIRTQKPIHGIDAAGNYFTVRRDTDAELQFTALLLKQHPYFEEQLTDDLQYFYLHKRRFLDENWFLNAFEEWFANDITILGFNELSGNKLNPHKIKIDVKVLSGINWFNTVINARFGKRKVSLKHLHKAIRNKTKFVQLDDGTLGILPKEWVEQFSNYFNAGEIISDDTLQTAKTNYTAITDWYDDGMLDEEVKQELKTYRKKLAAFDFNQMIAVPPGLKTELRHYQHEGLNWLNFLDDLNFGGCLADDMGLGKTIQIIAFILLQRQKVSCNNNLLVVPTSLIFNWQAEIQRFAPSIKVHTIYGAERIKSAEHLENYELVITSYGTLLADISYLKEHQFNYVFLDESQNIKNPGSQRYKAVRLLQSRNKIAITGTPIENNTFDLFSQLSFACPGLLGSRQYFKDIYSQPIDKFKVSKRTAELQQKIRPFILRRTKDEVATELPEKTEMILYCAMQDEQRKVYDAYEKEFREFISATTQEELPKKSMYVLKGLTRLRQICDSPLLIKGEKLPGKVSAKIDTLMEQIQSKSHQHKILVFSQFVGMLNLIGEELKKQNIHYTILTGSTRNREAVVNDFQENDEVRVFLVSLKAGGAGLNLIAADYVYLMEPWWNPAIENQAIDRIYRIGQKKNVVAVRLICPDTVEEKMMVLQQSKKELSDLLISSGNPLGKLSQSDLLSLLKPL